MPPGRAYRDYARRVPAGRAQATVALSCALTLIAAALSFIPAAVARALAFTSARAASSSTVSPR